MFDAQYLERNAKGYEGDFFMGQEFERLCKKHGIELIIETGSFLGNTTKQLAKLAPEVVTIESNPEYYAMAVENLKDLTNVKVYLGASESILPLLVDKHMVAKKVFWFIDSHWPECPLLDELHIISESGMKPVIAIHDFKVPGKTFGYDTYNGQPLNYAYVEEALIKIYGVHFSHHYNDKAAGAQRGVLYCEPI